MNQISKIVILTSILLVSTNLLSNHEDVFAISPPLPTIEVDRTDFLLRYTMSGGSIHSATLDNDANSLIIGIFSSIDGKVTITLPRELIDAKGSYGNDEKFFVQVDGIKTDFDETSAPGDRTLTIYFEGGSEEIEIIGSFVAATTYPIPSDVVAEKTFPSWIEKMISWYEKNIISESEFNNAFDFLREEGIIKSRSIISENRIIYGIPGDEKNWNIVATTFDGTETEIIKSFNFSGIEGQRPLQAVYLKLSPDGQHLLYPSAAGFQYFFTSLLITNIDTKEEKMIVERGENQVLSEVFWAPDSKRLSYSLRDLPPPCYNCGPSIDTVSGMSLDTTSGPWYIYNVLNDSSKIIREQTRSTGLVGWWDDEKLLFSESTFYSKKISFHLYNIITKEITPLVEVDYFPSVIINQHDNNVLTYWPSMDKKCEILLINAETRKVSHMSQLKDPCPTNYNQDFSLSQDGTQLMYGKIEAPFGGKIATTNVDKNGWYVIPSIYLINLKSHSESPVLLGKSDEKYIVFGGWKDELNTLAYLELKVEPEQETLRLLIANSDGSKSTEVAKIEKGRQEHWKEITFYGWKTVGLK